MSHTTEPSENQAELSWQHALRPRGRRYAGRAFDTASRHSIQIAVPANAAGLGASDQFIVVDFFYHAGTYWRARIPLDGVESIRGQAFNFSKARTRPGKNGPEIIFDRWGLPRRKLPCLNHVQSRFTFSPNRPIQLFPLYGDVTQEAAVSVDDMIYSIEAVGPLGVRFNLRDAVLGNLISAHRILSTREMVFERIVVENMYLVESPPLPLDAAKRRAALMASLQRSHRAAMSETYYLYRCFHANNCTAAPLREIDRIADYNCAQRLASNLYRFPINPRLYLRVRGLDADPHLRRLVREEFREYIADPATTRRKREFVRARTKQLRAARQQSTT